MANTINNAHILFIHASLKLRSFALNNKGRTYCHVINKAS
jgi:hypothetical protein